MLNRLQQASQIAGIAPDVEKAVADILKAASNPAAESVESAIASLDSDRRADVQTGIAELTTVFNGVSARASNALLTQFSDADFQRMIDESLDE